MIEVIKFIARFIKHLLLFVCILLPLQLFGALILLLYIPIKRRWFTSIKMGKALNEQLRLPYILRWFDNADIYPEAERNYTTYWSVYKQEWWGQYCWLAWRNPLNYFGYKILGKVVATNVADDIIGDGYNNVPGFRYIEVDNGYEYYWIYRYGTSDKCFRFRMGWKLAGAKKGQLCEYVALISPYHSYSGI